MFGQLTKQILYRPRSGCFNLSWVTRALFRAGCCNPAIHDDYLQQEHSQVLQHNAINESASVCSPNKFASSGGEKKKKKKKTRLETGCNRLTHLFMFHAKWLLLLSTHICTLSTRALIWYIMTNVYQLGCGCLCQIWATAPEKKRGEQEGEKERERESMWLFAAVCEQLSLHPCAHLCPPMSQTGVSDSQMPRR